MPTVTGEDIARLPWEVRRCIDLAIAIVEGDAPRRLEAALHVLAAASKLTSSDLPEQMMAEIHRRAAREAPDWCRQARGRA